MNLMNALVAYQMDDTRAPLPPVEDMLNDAEVNIARREERLARIEATVATTLAERSEASLNALQECLDDLMADDPNGAVRPQLANVSQMIDDIRHIYEGTRVAVVKTHEQLVQRAQQNMALHNELKNLQSQLKAGSNSQIRTFMKACAEKGASYAAK